jgi:hypothetical protein
LTPSSRQISQLTELLNFREVLVLYLELIAIDVYMTANAEVAPLWAGRRNRCIQQMAHFAPNRCHTPIRSLPNSAPR